ncbi:hypothetical protein T492DRAFT_868802, partial [Pavlovales sp. CCMP2436]
DFLLFAKLARARGVIGCDGWDWHRFCAAAGALLKTPFMQDDAANQYGAEQLLVAPPGGRSLRSTAELIYGTSPLATEADPFYELVQEQITTALYADVGDEQAGYSVVSLDNDPSLFEDVGGLEVWQDLLAAVS